MDQIVSLLVNQLVEKQKRNKFFDQNNKRSKANIFHRKKKYQKKKLFKENLSLRKKKTKKKRNK